MSRRYSPPLFLLVSLISCTVAEPGPAETAPSNEPRPATPGAEPQGSPGELVQGIRPRDDYFGVYLNGHKVGWMNGTLKIENGTARIGTLLNASVGGLGTVSKIRLMETRSYDVASRGLIGLEFSQEANTGAVKIIGKVINKQLELTITAGGSTSRSTVPVAGTLDDELAMSRLAAEAKPGSKAKSCRYDASMQKEICANHEVVASETRLFGGVEATTVRIDSEYLGLGIRDAAWVTREGAVLETHVGGFFVARLEPPDVAKKLDYNHDILVSAVVKTPNALPTATTADKMTVSFSGFSGELPQSLPRQVATQVGPDARFELKKDPEPTLAYPLGGTLPPDFLKATPFIQSDSDKIVAKAKEVVGDAATLHEAVTRLTRFVYEHVRDEYVPAYSNALEALDSGRGDCTEHSILFVALARAAGIPARVAVGIAYWPPGDGFGWHAWAEVDAGGVWYAVDPTWDQPIADVTHIKLAAGAPAEQARIVMLLGQLRVSSITL